MINKDICKAIKIRLIEKEMNQAQLAQAVGMPQKYLSDILRGKRGFNSKYLAKIFEVLDMDVEM